MATVHLSELLLNIMTLFDKKLSYYIRYPKIISVYSISWWKQTESGS